MATTTTDGTGRRFWTAGKKRAIALVVSVVGVGAILTFQSEGNPYNSIDNSDGTFIWGNQAAYNKRATDTMATIEALQSGTYGGFTDDDFTVTAASLSTAVDNGPQPSQGQFRITCNWSHIANDDPIIFPNQPGRSHAHLFWGNTQINAHTTADQFGTGSEHDLFDNGGSTCQGGPINRSAYWMPVMYDGPAGTGRNIVIPKNILLYYKSHRPEQVQPFPDGIQLLVGNLDSNGAVQSSFSPSFGLHWGCYDAPNGQTISTSYSGTIPLDCNETSSWCPAGNCDIQATIQFPQCIATDNNQETGTPTRGSANHIDHTLSIQQTNSCPSSHPYRVPQISYLIRWEGRPDAEVAEWRLSCDTGWATASIAPTPGGCLHGDWFGAWSQLANQAWLDGCFDPDKTPPYTNAGTNNFAGPRNCSGGQTGQNGTGRLLVRNSGLGYTSNYGYIADPCPTCTPIPN